MAWHYERENSGKGCRVRLGHLAESPVQNDTEISAIVGSAKSLQFLMDPPYERDFLQAEGPDEENPPLLQKVFFGRKAIPPRCRLDRIPGKTSFQPGSSAEITFD